MNLLVFTLAMIATVSCIMESVTRFRGKLYSDAIAFLCLALFLFCAPADRAARIKAEECATTLDAIEVAR
jgi:hypothetical protein